MYGYIYKTLDTITNKLYIGQKKSTKFCPNYYGSGVIIKNIIKQRKCSLIVEMIDTADTKEELNDKEIYYISLYNSTNPQIGYNLSTGGCINRGWHHSENSKSKISNATKGLKRNDKSKELMSNQRKGGYWVNNGVEQKHIFKDELNYYLSKGFVKGQLPGRINGPMSQSTKNKISTSHTGKKHSDEHTAKLKASFESKHYHWYTNGKDNVMLSEFDDIPDGYKRGKYVSDEFKLKVSNGCKLRYKLNK